MRPLSAATAALGAALLLLAGPLAAQSRDDRAPRRPRAPITDPRGFVGGGLAVAEPLGEFRRTTRSATGFGATGHFLGALDENAILNWRVDAAFLTYGNVTQRVPLSPTLGNLIRVDLRTSNNIFTLVTGPQLLAPTGAFAPYVNALGGFSVFWTTSTVEGSNNVEPFASTTNTADASWAYGASAGAYVRVKGGAFPIHLDVGARYLRHDDAKYLTRQQIIDAANSGGAFDRIVPSRTRADAVTYYAGVSVTVF